MFLFNWTKQMFSKKEDDTLNKVLNEYSEKIRDYLDEAEKKRVEMDTSCNSLVVEDPVLNEVVKDVVEDPVLNEVKEEPVQEVVEEPVLNEVKEEPIVEEVESNKKKKKGKKNKNNN